MGTRNWYEEWKAKEDKLAMNFGKYIGVVKNQDPGARQARQILLETHLKLGQKVGTTRRQPGELDQLSNFLTMIFFGGQNGDDTQVASRFLNTLIKSYDKIYNESIQMAEGFGGDITKSQSFSSRQIVNKMEEIRKKEKDKDQIENRCLNTIHTEIMAIENILNGITIKAPAKDIERKMKKIYDNYDTIVMLYKYQAGDSAELPNASEFDSQWDKVKSKMLIRDDIIIDLVDLGKVQKGDGLKGGKGSTKSNLIETLNEFELYCKTLKNLALVTPATYGNVLEYGIALANIYTEVVTDQAEKMTAQKIQQLQKTQKKYVTGGNVVSRGGGEHILSIDVNRVFDDNLTKYTEGNSDLKDIAILRNGATEIDNIKLSTDKLDGALYTDEKKQAKVDVILNAPDAAGDLVGGKKYKISAKNWSTIDSGHDLGFTSYLRGIDRTVRLVSSNEEALLNYIYTMQHPIDGEKIPNGDFVGDPEIRRTVATAAVNLGHHLAKESLMLDIAMGLSQNENSADTLVIMDRQKKRVIVIDLIDEIRKFMNNSKSAFVLEGYDSENVESTARAFRNVVRQNVSYVGRDRNYVSLMKLYLNSKKASVKLSQNYIQSLG